MKNVSIVKEFGLPPEFGLLVLSFAFILLVAPYFAGLDFGVVKIPEFPQGLRRRLVFLGPIFFALALIIHVPILRRAAETRPPPTINSADQEKPRSRPEEPLRQPPASPLTRLVEPQQLKSPPKPPVAAPDDPLQTQLKEFLVELDKIERNWKKDHVKVVPLAERAAAVLKTRYPESAEKIKNATSLPMSQDVDDVVRVEIQKVLDQMNVERHE